MSSLLFRMSLVSLWSTGSWCLAKMSMWFFVYHVNAATCIPRLVQTVPKLFNIFPFPFKSSSINIPTIGNNTPLHLANFRTVRTLPASKSRYTAIHPWSLRRSESKKLNPVRPYPKLEDPWNYKKTFRGPEVNSSYCCRMSATPFTSKFVTCIVLWCL